MEIPLDLLDDVAGDGRQFASQFAGGGGENFTNNIRIGRAEGRKRGEPVVNPTENDHGHAKALAMLLQILSELLGDTPGRDQNPPLDRLIPSDGLIDFP